MLKLIEELSTPPYRGLSGMALTEEQLGQIRHALGSNDLPGALTLLGERWRPPTLGRVAQLDDLIHR
jgi:hypothetical protein